MTTEPAAGTAIGAVPTRAVDGRTMIGHVIVCQGQDDQHQVIAVWHVDTEGVNTGAWTLGHNASDRGLTRRRTCARIRIANTAATNYQVLNTGPVAPGIGAESATEHSLWLSWMVPLEDDVAKRPPDVAALVLGERRADRPNYRVRVLPDGRVRGRAKISIALLDGTARARIPGMLSELCPRAQREVIATLVRDHVPMRGDPSAPGLAGTLAGPREHGAVSGSLPLRLDHSEGVRPVSCVHIRQTFYPHGQVEAAVRVPANTASLK